MISREMYLICLFVLAIACKQKESIKNFDSVPVSYSLTDKKSLRDNWTKATLSTSLCKPDYKSDDPLDIGVMQKELISRDTYVPPMR